MSREANRRSFFGKAVAGFTVAASGLALPATALADRWGQDLAIKEVKPNVFAAVQVPEEIVPLNLPTEESVYVGEDQLILPGTKLLLPEGSSIISEREVPPFECPILTFHEVGKPKAGEPWKFGDTILRYVRDGYVPVNAETLEKLLRGEEVPLGGKRPFVITLDDTLLSQRENALPFLKQFKFPALFAVMPDWNGDGVHKYMNDDDIRMLVAEGFDVVSHTFHHPQDLTALKNKNNGSWQAQIVASKQKLEELLKGYKVRGFCYPYGAGINDQETLDLVSKTYGFALSTLGGKMQSSNIKWVLRRISVT